MELHPVESNAPDRSASPPFPVDVSKTLSFLANLIDESIRVRGTGISVRDWAANLLGIETSEVAITTVSPGALMAQLTAIAFAAALEEHPPAAVIGSDQEEPPDWVKLDLGETSIRVPGNLAAWFPAGRLLLPPVVVQVQKPWNADGVQFSVYSRPEHVAAAEAYLDALAEAGRQTRNPFKNRVLETVPTMVGLTYRVHTLPASARADVVLPNRIWVEIDRNVRGLFEALPRLEEAGLAVNRGVLLTGPPGTGKTALCRAVANELAGEVTIIFCTSKAIQEHVTELYAQLKYLAPALVVMEDVDLVIGNRNYGASSSLLDFLVALDGAMSEHSGVATIATTNDPQAIDPAAKRSARFDVLIEVPTPDHEGRIEILGKYLEKVEHAATIDTDRVARLTEGFSGADLRELVSDALLHVAASSDTSSVVTTELLVRLAVERRPRAFTGLYL